MSAVFVIVALTPPLWLPRGERRGLQLRPQQDGEELVDSGRVGRPGGSATRRRRPASGGWSWSRTGRRSAMRRAAPGVLRAEHRVPGVQRSASRSPSRRAGAGSARRPSACPPSTWFATTDVTRLEASTDVENIGEQRSLGEGRGFVREDGCALRRAAPTGSTTSTSTPSSDPTGSGRGTRHALRHGSTCRRQASRRRRLKKKVYSGRGGSTHVEQRSHRPSTTRRPCRPAGEARGAAADGGDRGHATPRTSGHRAPGRYTRPRWSGAGRVRPAG